MIRKPLTWICVLVVLSLLGNAGGQETGEKPAYLRVLVPQDDAKLLFDGSPTKQTGASRLFVTPPLKLGKTFSYTVVAKWEPNNYTKVTRTRVVELQAGKEIELDLRKADPDHPDDFLIRYVPTPEVVVEAMCKLAKVGKD